jgi:ribosomal protein S18 acetylase RimI-like enzyme
MRIEALSDRHERSAFRCGVDALDRYFRNQAGQDVRRRVSSCFVLVEDRGHRPLGYYTLSSTAIELGELPATMSRRLPRYPWVPATLMGRLAVSVDHRGRRFGELLLMDAFERVLRSEIASAAFVVDAKDDSAAGFYAKYDFLRLNADGRRMFLPMATIARLFS